MSRAFRLLQRWFFTGLLVWMPFVGTIVLFVWAFEFLDSWSRSLQDRVFGRHFPGVGLAILMLSTLTVGALVSNFIGKRLVELFEAIINRIPAVNFVYRFIKDFSDTFLNRDKQAFKEVVAVEYPRKGIWTVGFVTGPVPRGLEAVDGEEKVLVFLMQAFSPAAGYLVAVHRSEAIKLDMPVDEALKLILTGGLVKTDHAGPALADAPAGTAAVTTLPAVVK